MNRFFLNISELFSDPKGGYSQFIIKYKWDNLGTIFGLDLYEHSNKVGIIIGKWIENDGKTEFGTYLRIHYSQYKDYGYILDFIDDYDANNFKHVIALLVETCNYLISLQYYLILDFNSSFKISSNKIIWKDILMGYSLKVDIIENGKIILENIRFNTMLYDENYQGMIRLKSIIKRS